MKSLEDKPSFSLTIAENEKRGEVSPIDRGLSYKRAIEVCGGTLDQRTLAQQRGMTKGAMSQ